MTAATDEARAKARRRREEIIAANPSRLCPPEHKHGLTSTCYNGHGCRCDHCRDARAVMKRIEYYGSKGLLRADVKVSSVGVMRRLQALAFMGWSCQVIAERIGSHYRPLTRLRDGGRERVMQSTHNRVDAVFRELAFVEAPGHSGRVTRGAARKRGWVHALAWDDIDDPDGWPRGVSSGGRVRVDREMVAWLAGEGASDVEISRRLKCSARTVFRVRVELGLESKWVA